MTLPDDIPVSGPSPRLQRGVLAALAIGAVIGLGGLFAVRMMWGDPTPRATYESYRTALERWNRTAPRDYDIEIRVAGRQPAEYRVEVRGGDARAAFRNGKPLQQRRTFYTWSVDGMFETLAGDMARMPPGAGKAAANDPAFELRVRFDDRFGFPARYHRIEFGTGMEVEWSVTKFEVAPAEHSPEEPKS